MRRARRLTAFAMTAAEPGRLAMFDEPTNDVDPVRRRLLWGQVRALAADGRAVVLVTHNVTEAEKAVDRLVILDRGRVVAHGRPAELRGEGNDQLRLEATVTDGVDAGDLVAGFSLGTEPALLTGRRMMVPINAADCPAALAWAQREQRAGRIDEFSFNPVSLEDIYVRLVGRQDRDAEAPHASLAA